MKNAQLASSPWQQVDQPIGRIDLVLDAASGDEDPVEDLSAAVRVGNTLFLGSDEGTSIERLLFKNGRWDSHVRLPLDELLKLEPSGEADIEGLAEDDGWLWVIGSHARTRPKIRKRDDDRIDLTSFSNLNDTRGRCLVARLPLVADPAIPGAMVPTRRDGKRRAASLKQNKHGNSLAQMLKQDPLLKPFTRVPAKEGGVDLEGIAVAGSRVAIGMRGPVVQTYAVLLETEITGQGGSHLRIDGPLYKRLLDLEGLGIRDLKRLGSDLLILAGPTTGLDGPCSVYRWRDWLSQPAEHKNTVCLHRPERILDLPFGRGDDHPEGLATLEGEDERTHLLVVCDGPAAFRFNRQKSSIACDLFLVPN